MDMPDKTREYVKSHPHITFRVDLRRADPALWLLLGEVKSKSEHVARTLLKPEISADLLRVYLTKGALATTAIEGNTLSEDEARQVLDEQLKLPPSKEYLGREIRNVVDAFNLATDQLLENPRRELTVKDVLIYNRTILDGLDLEEGIVPGQIRDYSVVVGGVYRAAPARDCEYLLERLCAWLNGDDLTAPPEQPELAAPYAVLAAILAHVYLAWIHPFGDGNGRTARLLELWVLLKAGFPLPVTQLLSNHYNVTRSEYYRQLNRASKTGDVMAFLLYAIRGFVDGLREQLDVIWRQQFADRWEQYVYQRFGEIKTPSARRRLRLVLELSRQGEPVRRAEVRHLTAELAEMYATKTDKTLTRDLNALREMDLIHSTRGGYVPNDQVILGFMPPRNDGVLAVETAASTMP
jgi:cell filamentation protein, protein adenylyltransferase